MDEKEVATKAIDKLIKKKGKGRPCKKGDSIKLKELFEIDNYNITMDNYIV